MRIGLEIDCLAQPHYSGVAQGVWQIASHLCAHDHLFFAKKGPTRPLPSQAHITVRDYSQVDLVHLPHPKFWFAKPPRTPYVLNVHDLVPLLFPQFHFRTSHIFYKFFLKRFMTHARKVFTASEATKSDLIKYYKLPEEKIHLVPWAITPREPAQEKKPYLLFVGTLEPRKNVETLILAFRKLRSWGHKHKLLLVGQKGWGYEKIFALAKGDPSIEIKGYVSEEEKRALIAKATLFVYPSFYEGFGLPILEAMAAKTAVVTSNCSSMREVAEKSACLVDPHSAEALGLAMHHLLLSDAKRKQFEEAGFLRAAHFSEKRMFDALWEGYEAALA